MINKWFLMHTKEWERRGHLGMYQVSYTITTTASVWTTKTRQPTLPRKILGEVKLDERKTCLGWDIKPHSLRLFLPKENHTSWVNDIKDVSASTKINTDTLESLIGKLNQAEHVIPPVWYFLNWLRHLLKREKIWVPQHLQPWYRQDLQLWIKFLQWVTTESVPINNILFFVSTVTLWSDSCEYGIGGYSDNGLAWQWRIPPEWHGKLTLNLL